jgi:hypothetical protein
MQLSNQFAIDFREVDIFLRLLGEPHRFNKVSHNRLRVMLI